MSSLRFFSLIFREARKQIWQVRQLDKLFSSSDGCAGVIFCCWQVSQHAFSVCSVAPSPGTPAAAVYTGRCLVLLGRELQNIH